MPRLTFGKSARHGHGLAMLITALLMAGLALPAHAGALRTQLDLVKDSIYFDANTKAAHQWHALEQYMVMAYKLGGNSPQFNFEARGICNKFQPKHQARLDALDAWVKTTETPTPPVIVPKLTPFEGAANTADAIDLALRYEVELVDVLTDLEATVSDAALKEQMRLSRFESAHLAVRLCEWLQYDPPTIIADTLAEEKQAAAATTP